MSSPAPWWQKLPENYYQSPQFTELDVRHPFKVRSTAAADLVLRNQIMHLHQGEYLRLMKKFMDECCSSS